MSSLVLHLIEVRYVFIAGGENRLRLAVCAFALGIIMVQRMSRSLGSGYARAYGAALGAAITLFAVYLSYAYLLPTPPFLVFLINEALFIVLWWTGHKITSACWVDSPMMDMAAAETGMLSKKMFQKNRKENEEKKSLAQGLAENLPRNHPGRVILIFSLFAIPAFGAGIQLLSGADAASRLRMGIFLFVYLWCAFALLFLSNLSRLAAYFEKRDVGLPDRVGLPWLSGGFLATTIAILAAFFLPQAPTVSGMYVRTRIQAVYRGWQSKGGLRDSAKPSTEEGTRPGGEPLSSEKLDSEKAVNILDKRYEKFDKLNDPYISDMARNTGIEPEYRNVLLMAAAANETFSTVFGVVIKIVFVITAMAALVVLFIMLTSAWSGARQSFLKKHRQKKEDKEARRKEAAKKLKERPAASRFRQFADPFAAAAIRDGDALVRYMWEAMLAWCNDYGTPCPSDKTPFEFVESKPDALEGFEESALYIARLFTYSEYSGEKVGDEETPALKKFWSSLRRHARLSDS